MWREGGRISRDRNVVFGLMFQAQFVYSVSRTSGHQRVGMFGMIFEKDGIRVCNFVCHVQVVVTVFVLMCVTEVNSGVNLLFDSRYLDSFCSSSGAEQTAV